METFKAVTFNMQFGQGWDEKDPDNAPVRLEETIEFLQSLDADVILLQEVERAQKGGIQIEPAPNYTELRTRLSGYHSVFAYPQINPQELPFGIALAIFSRWKLRDFRAEHLPPPKIKFQFDDKWVHPSHRQLISAGINLAGREVRLMNTHLQAFFMIAATSDEHPEQRNIIENQLREQTVPTILGGDFNCAPEECVVDQFKSAGYHAVQTTEITWRRRPYVLDHLFYNHPLRMVSHRVIPTLCSDHHALLGEFAFA